MHLHCQLHKYGCRAERARFFRLRYGLFDHMFVQLVAIEALPRPSSSFQISGWSPSYDAQLSATIAAKILVFGYSTSEHCGHEQTCAGIRNVLSLTTAETPVSPQ
jgi:hypothetical protein